jgi:hypothetical protein
VANQFVPETGYFEALGLPADSPNSGRRMGREALLKFAQGLYDANQGHGRHVTSAELIEEMQDGKATFKAYLACGRAGSKRLSWRTAVSDTVG